MQGSARSRCALALLVLLTAPALAQLQPGDVGIVNFSNANLAVVQGGQVLTYPITGLGPATNGGYADGIVWDPTSPDSFLVAAELGIGRVTITGPGTAVTTFIASYPTATPSYILKWRPDGTLVFANGGGSNLFILDPVTGVTAPFPVAGGGWVYVGAVVADASTGDLFVGEGQCCPGSASIWRVTNGAASLLVQGLGGSPSAMTQDLATGDLLATIWGANRVVRITQAGAVTDLIPPGSISGLDGISFDTNGDLLVLSRFNPTIYRLVGAVGPAVAETVLTGFNSPVEIAVAGVASPPLNAFSLSVAAPANGSFDLAIANLPAGISEGWTLFTTSTPTPLGQGPVFGIVPDAATFSIILGFPVAGIGNPLHWLAGWPGFFPDAPLALPPGSTAALSGQTWDFLAIALDQGQQILGVTTPRRVTFP